jgi:hypothetical protein
MESNHAPARAASRDPFRSSWKSRVLRGFIAGSGALGVFACARSAAAQATPEGHVGVAVPLVSVSGKTTTVADQFTLLTPIGVGLAFKDSVVVDFEVVVATAVDPGGPTGLVVDPGVVYNFGPVAAGLRVAFQIGQRGNVGLIPLVNKGLVDLGGATWFVEAAFPTFFSAESTVFNVVLHTGVGF